MPTPPPTIAAQLLRKALSPPSWTRRAIAEHLGVSQQAVGQWLSGEVRPDLRNREALAALLGIPIEDWRTPEEHADLDDLQRARRS